MEYNGENILCGNPGMCFLKNLNNLLSLWYTQVDELLSDGSRVSLIKGELFTCSKRGSYTLCNTFGHILFICLRREES